MTFFCSIYNIFTLLFETLDQTDQSVFSADIDNDREYYME